MDEVINSENNEKMCEYCKTCVCKSCEQVAWLEQENEHLKKSIEYDSRYNDMQAELDCNEKLLTKYVQALLDIKDIADENKDTAQYRGICLSILTKINEVFGKIL